MARSAPGQASSTALDRDHALTGRHGEWSGSRVVPGSRAVLQVHDLDRRRESSRGCRHVVTHAEGVGGVEADGRARRRPDRAARSTCSAVRSPWFSSASRIPWPPAAAHASRKARRDAARVSAAMSRTADHDAHHGKPERGRRREPRDQARRAPRGGHRTRIHPARPTTRPSATSPASARYTPGSKRVGIFQEATSPAAQSRGRGDVPRRRRRASPAEDVGAGVSPRRTSPSRRW